MTGHAPVSAPLQPGPASGVVASLRSDLTSRGIPLDLVTRKLEHLEPTAYALPATLWLRAAADAWDDIMRSDAAADAADDLDAAAGVRNSTSVHTAGPAEQTGEALAEVETVLLERIADSTAFSADDALTAVRDVQRAYTAFYSRPDHS